MVAADHDGRGKLAALDHLVEGQSQAMTLSQTDPADARRQSLEMNLRTRHIEPVMQMRVVRDQLFDFCVGLVDVLGVPGERNPAERPDSAAEQRPDVFRKETRGV